MNKKSMAFLVAISIIIMTVISACGDNSSNNNTTVPIQRVSEEESINHDVNSGDGNAEAVENFANKKHFYQLIDNYYETPSGQQDFFAEQDSLNRLQEYNNSLADTFEENFFEFGACQIEPIGRWTKDEDLVMHEEGKNFLNQEVAFAGNTIFISALHAVQGNQNFYNKVDLVLEKGSFFDPVSYEYNSEFIPVVMGFDFQSGYAIGDNFDFLYLSRVWHGKIIGFLKQDTSIDLVYTQHELNKYVLMPFVTYIGEDTILTDDETMYGESKDFFLKMYWLFRNNAVIYINDRSEFDSSKKITDDLAKKYNLDFQLLRGY